MLCRYFRKRQKNYQDYFYCERKRKQVPFHCYQNCSKWQPREFKAINLVSKKRKKVSSSTYNEVFRRDNGMCQLCGTPYNLQLHHIIYRSENKNLIDTPSNCIMLCDKCHRKVHSNKSKYKGILQTIVEVK